LKLDASYYLADTSSLTRAEFVRFQFEIMEFQGHDNTDFVSKIRIERRKAQKPRIEKLRRDRINGSLDEIKHLVLEALNKDSSRYSKMEKADILEMTVQFLKGAQARKRLQTGIRSQTENTAQIRTEPSATQIPRLSQDQLLMGMNTDIKPIPVMSHSMSPFVSAPMVAMATQPTIVWLPFPSPPQSPTEQGTETADSSTKQSLANTGNENRFLSRTCGITSVSSPGNVMLPVWRPW